MSSQSVRFATAVLAAFEAAGAVTDAEVGRAGGPSTTTMTKLRKAALGELDMAEPRNDTYRRIEAVAGWEPGAARTLWRDGVRPLPRRPSGLEGLGFKTTRVTPAGIDAYLQELADRITELEERVDLLEAGGRSEAAVAGADLVVTNPDGSTSVVQAKRRELTADLEAMSGQARSYLFALLSAAHEESRAAEALNERLVEQGRVDPDVGNQARIFISHCSVDSPSASRP